MFKTISDYIDNIPHRNIIISVIVVSVFLIFTVFFLRFIIIKSKSPNEKQ